MSIYRVYFVHHEEDWKYGGFLESGIYIDVEASSEEEAMAKAKPQQFCRDEFTEEPIYDCWFVDGCKRLEGG